MKISVAAVTLLISLGSLEMIQLHMILTTMILAIYAPKISTAPYVMVFLGADAFTRANVKGWEPGNREYVRPCEMAASR